MTTSSIEAKEQPEDENNNNSNNNNNNNNNNNTSDDSDTNTLFNDPDILPNFCTSSKGSGHNETLCSSNLSLNTEECNSNSILPETSLAFKRKQFLKKINNKEKEFLFKNELNLYKDFKEHNIEIEDYGRLILNKMGYDEETYNTYINKYYKETSNSNYFDKIYEQFHTRIFRFTGVGTEAEMEENLEHIKKEEEKGGIIKDEENTTTTATTTTTNNNNNNKKENRYAHVTELKKSIRDTYHAKKEEGKKTDKKKRKYENRFDNELVEWKSTKHDTDNKRESEKRECYSVVDKEKNEKKKILNFDFFEGLIVKINGKSHEHYKKKGIIIFKRKRRDNMYYGLLLFKNYDLISFVRKKILRKMELAYDEEPTDVKHFWVQFIKELNKKVSIEKEEKRYDIDEKRKKITDYFDVAEVKGKYLETVIKNNCSKCKIVSTYLRHPKKKTSIHKETVELLKMKSDCAYIKLRKKYNMKVSLDDICECIDYIVGRC